MNDTSEPVRVERRGHTLIVTLNRPEAKNACNLAMARGVHAAMDRLDEDDDLFIGIVAGAGGTFCAGADLKALERGERGVTERGGFGMFKRPSRKPLIAAVEGYAVGGGLELCLCCDLIVAASNAKLGLPEVRHNVVAVGGGLFRLPRRIPYHLAMELALTGQLRDAASFHQYGLVNRVCAPGAALDEAMALAEALLVNGPTALAASKQIMRQASDWTDTEAWEKQAPIAARAFESEDRLEGVRAFAEKRKPVWRGR